jgi:hypothetical protein
MYNNTRHCRTPISLYVTIMYHSSVNLVTSRISLYSIKDNKSDSFKMFTVRITYHKFLLSLTAIQLI